MVALTEAAHAIGADERTFRRAVADGTVRVQERSPRRRVLDDDEVAYLSTHWDLIARLRRALRTEPNVRLAVLYGSAARGDDGEDSDADVLVSFGPDRDGDRIRLAMRLERALGREVDVARLNRIDSSAPLLLLQAIDEGRVVLDRDDQWRSVQDRRSDIERRAGQDHTERCRRAREAVLRLLEEDD